MSKAGKGNKTISVILPEDTYELLKNWADAKEWSVSQAARKLITKGIEQEAETKGEK